MSNDRTTGTCDRTTAGWAGQVLGCMLLAGHEGMHRDRTGAEWTAPRGVSFDFDRPEIREMVRHNHTPTERWYATGVLAGVRCDCCGHPWPCPTLAELDAWEASGAMGTPRLGERA